MSIEPSAKYDPERRRVERITLAISILVLQLLVGLLIYQAVVLEEGPPVIAVEAHFEDLRREGNSYYLPVTIANQGQQTAEAVRVLFRLLPPPGAAAEPEVVEFVVAFLPGGGAVDGAVAFQRPPTPETVRYVVSYLEP